MANAQVRPGNGLRALARRVAYNNIIDVWTALCEDKGLDPGDAQAFVRFLRYVKAQGLKVRALPVCPPAQSYKAELARLASSFFGSPPQALVLRLDEKSIEVLLSFPEGGPRA
ncbi:MAG: hypothetical protein C4339_00050 [Nitrososphaerota archaeon]